MSAKHNSEYIPADQEVSLAEEEAVQILERPAWEVTLTELANKPGHRVRVPRATDLKRRRVVNAFQDAFELIGGTTRLALWADENPTEFFKLYGKLMPKQEETTHDGGLTIRHILPRGPLDD